MFKKLRRLSGRVKNLRIVLNPKAIVAWGKFRTLKKRAAAYEAYTLRLNESVSQTTKMLFEALNGAKEPDARGISDGIHSIEVDIAEARERITNLFIGILPKYLLNLLVLLLIAYLLSFSFIGDSNVLQTQKKQA